MRHRLRYVKTDDELAWALPADGIVLGKSYKIKWRIRLGRGVASGTQLPLTVSVADWMEDEVVSVDANGRMWPMAGTGGYALWLLLLRNVRGQENCWWKLKVFVNAKHLTEGAT